MKRNELVDELNNALFDDNDGKRNTSLIQTNLNWEQWKELAPYMDFRGYRFETLFEDMPEDEWENNEELQELAWLMAECANYITAVLIDPYDHDYANVIFANGIIEKDGGKDFDNCYYVVNV